ncbi:hypothetical protein CCP4SC76_2080002 [Gammaproteobacteria bacterium]
MRVIYPHAISLWPEPFQHNHREQHLHQDRTDRIPWLEGLEGLKEAGRQLLFIRPRRFDKSLLLSMLEHYYDLSRAGDFDTGLAIGQNPTPLHTQYLNTTISPMKC